MINEYKTNMEKTKPSLGILGGLGPRSTLLFYEYLTNIAEIHKEQDHLQCIIYSNPKIRDRTAAILDNDSNIVYELIESCYVLKNAGVDKILITCISAHHFLPELIKETSMHFYDVIEICAKSIIENNLTKCVLFASTGTCISKICYEKFTRYGTTILYPKDNEQKEIMNLIYSVKLEGINSTHLATFNRLISKYDTNSIIMGCTELSVLSSVLHDTRLIDPLKIVANKIVKELTSTKSTNQSDI